MSESNHTRPKSTRENDAERAPRAEGAGDDATGDVVLRLDGVTKRYGTEEAVTDLSIDIREGELLTLLGPSGCGKTTTLRLMAGLERPSEGTVELNGDHVAGEDAAFVEPEDRGVGVVFQDFALFPHLNVRENVAFGLTDLDDEATDRRVDDLLDLVNLAGMGERAPDELSGGQQQRVALARSLAPEPDILLLDEPFSNLDVRLRVRMREEVREILKEAGVTAVSVTHDQEEALSISERVAVMNDGRIEQVGRPGDVFEDPESRFVASFLGQAGFLSTHIGESRIETTIGTYDHDLLRGYADQYVGATVDTLVRPDDLRATPANESTADGHITKRQYTGPSFVYHVRLDNGDEVRCMHNHAERFEVDEPVAVELVADHALAWYPTE
ncbi:ABC transporter ATP-binding protein [Halarchaeum acidiphilum MH1-52-1]|uniref:Molybdate/tungstate import ATP-binding protein WtpC n=1 Tax=Halarchaeum acidiphilum MH1-52-1 TaxID=1261545 RepID=U3A4M9_9EURY|nr:ABC transporter ATP-binding protein [Halarchaeum acidiphilum]GAD52599.1 ABC transporter ATP-binding protein [Halarchaeum acidiphilum MH1-52-1]